MHFRYKETAITTALLLTDRNEITPDRKEALMDLLYLDLTSVGHYHIIFLSRPFEDKRFNEIRELAISWKPDILVIVTNEVINLVPLGNEMIIELQDDYTNKTALEIIDTINRIFKCPGGLICFDYGDFKSLSGKLYGYSECKWKRLEPNPNSYRSLIILSYSDSEKNDFDEICRVVPEGNELIVDIINSNMITERKIMMLQSLTNIIEGAE